MAQLGGLFAFGHWHARTLATVATVAAVWAVAAAVAAPRSAVGAAVGGGPVPFPAPLSVACGGDPRVRKEAGSLSPAEWATYQRAVTGLHARETSGRRSTLDWFERFIEIHAAHAGNAHGGAHFLAWHRLFLLAYENALRTVEPSVTIPYWDWSMDAADPAMAPVWATSQLGKAADGSRIGAGERAAGHNFNEFFVDTDGPHYVTRGFYSNRGSGMDPDFFADKPTVRALWRNQQLSFAEFASTLEYVHGGPHVAMGGFSGGDLFLLDRAAGDVAFWSHHAYIDFIWAMRQQAISVLAYGGTTQDGSPARLDDVLAPFGATARTAAELNCVTYVADPRRTRGEPLATSAATPTPSPTPTSSATPTPSATSTPSAIPTASPTPAATLTPPPTPSPTRQPTPTPSAIPTVRVTPTSSAVPDPRTPRSDRTTAPAVPTPGRPACKRSHQCGCGVCKNGQCFAGEARRTRHFCGGGLCVESGAQRALVCRCTIDSHCGCGACDKASGICKAPSEARRAVHCGPTGACLVAGSRRARVGLSFSCSGGTPCASHKACGCGACVGRRCVARAWRTRRKCGSAAACVVAGRTMACTAERRSPRMAAVAAVAAAVRPHVASVGPGGATGGPPASAIGPALAALKQTMAAARAEAATILAAAEAEAEDIILLADAEIDQVREEEEAIQGVASRAGASATAGWLMAAVRGAGGASAAAATAAAAATKLAALDRTRVAAEAARRAAVDELAARKKEVKRHLRVTALAGFAAVNGMDAYRFTLGEVPLERAEDEAEAEEREAAAAAVVARTTRRAVTSA